MKVGIIGVGNIGGTLAKKFARAGHEVQVAAARGASQIRQQVEEMGAQAVEVTDVAKGVDVLILSVPFSAMPELASAVAKARPDVVLIDTSNYYPFRDGQMAELDSGKPESGWSSEQIGRPVIKAFNAVLAFTLAERGLPAGAKGRLALPVAGDDSRGKAIAAELVEAAGFDAVDAGGLAESWRQQPGNPAYCTELTSAELRDALASAELGRGARKREELMAEFIAASAFPDHDTVIRRNREVAATRDLAA